MAIAPCLAALKFQDSGLFGTRLRSSIILPLRSASKYLTNLFCVVYFKKNLFCVRFSVCFSMHSFTLQVIY